MPTWYDTLFYCVFLAQIVLISFYYPEKLRRRILGLLETYPPAEYPRLYPKPVEVYRRRIQVFRIVTLGIFALGIVLLVALATVIDHKSFAADGFISEAWPAGYAMIQILPFVLLEVTEASQLKLMRQAKAAHRRRAALRPRRLLELVSPVRLSLAALLFVGAIVFDLAVHGFDFSLGHDTMQRAVTLAVTNLFFVAVGAYLLRGRKPDPYQSPDDREHLIGVALRSQVFASMAISVFFILLAAGDALAMPYLDATLNSLYFQAIVFLSIGHILRSVQLDDLDFEVYRSEPAGT